MPLPHKNAHWHRHSSRSYTAELRELIRERFRADIDRFGYELEARGPLRDVVRTIAVTSAQVVERAGRVAARVAGGSPEVSQAPRQG